MKTMKEMKEVMALRVALLSKFAAMYEAGDIEKMEGENHAGNDAEGVAANDPRPDQAGPKPAEQTILRRRAKSLG